MGSPKKWAWVGAGIGLTGGLLWLLAALLPQTSVRLPSGHFAPRFRIGKDTTYITEPIDAEGYPDYEEALNRYLSKGVNTDENRIVALLKATGPKPLGELFPRQFYDRLEVSPPPDQGDYLIALRDCLMKDASLDRKKRGFILYKTRESCENRPWKKGDHPQIAAWLDQNQRPLATAIEAVQKPHYYHPVIDPDKEGPFGNLGTAKSFLHSVVPELLSLLSCRAMLEIENKDYRAARQSLLTGLKLIHSFPPNLSVDLIHLNRLEQGIYAQLHVLSVNAAFSTMELESLAHEIEAIGPFPPVAELLNYADRLVMLDEALLANKLGAERVDFMIGITDPSIPKEEYSERIEIITNRTNHGKNLSLINQCIDKAVVDLKIVDPFLRRDAILRTKDQAHAKSLTAMEGLDEESKSWRSGPFSFRANMSVIGLKLSNEAIVYPMVAQGALDETEEIKRLFLTSLALAKFRAETGNYPESLEELVPKYLKTIPQDLFSGRNPRYRIPNDGGYLLYSVGVNRGDSGGRHPKDDPSSDDIVVKVPLPPLR